MQTTLFKKIIITIFVIHVHKLFVCFHKKSTLEYDFKVVSSSDSYAGPSLWNTLPVHLKNRNLALTTFMRHLKSYLFSQY